MAWCFNLITIRAFHFRLVPDELRPHFVIIVVCYIPKRLLTSSGDIRPDRLLRTVALRKTQRWKATISGFPNPDWGRRAAAVDFFWMSYLAGSAVGSLGWDSGPCPWLRRGLTIIATLYSFFSPDWYVIQFMKYLAALITSHLTLGTPLPTYSTRCVPNSPKSLMQPY